MKKLGQVYTFNDCQTIDVICKIEEHNGEKRYWYHIFLMEDVLDKDGKVLLSGGGSWCELECMTDSEWEACAFACNDGYKYLGQMNKEWGIAEDWRLTNNKKEFKHKWQPRK